MLSQKVIQYDNSNYDNYITITTNESGISAYTYCVNDNVKKTTFNKYSFIEYLKSATKVKQKYIKEIERS